MDNPGHTNTLSPESLPEDNLSKIRAAQPAGQAPVAQAPVAQAPVAQGQVAQTAGTQPPLQRASTAQAPTAAATSPVRQPVPATSQSGAKGFVIRCDGEYAVISSAISPGASVDENFWAVGQITSVQVGTSRVIGLACKVDVADELWRDRQGNQVEVTLELVGEIVAGKEGSPDKFSSGIANYPTMGCVASKITSADLAVIYRSEGDSVVGIGHLTQDPSVDAKIDIDKLLSRHFAIVGTTGVGKSTSVTLMMRKIVKTRPEIRVLMLDPHNEFATAFPDNSIVIDSGSLQLPFWLFRLDEFAEVVFRGQSGFEAEAEILRDLIPQAKELFKSDGGGKSTKLSRKGVRTNITADMPVPYRLPDLLKLIDDRLGLLDNKSEKPILKSLMHRLETISKDPRFRFMFESGSSGDIMENVLSKIFRVPQNDKPICVLEMSGLPSEVVNSVVSVLCRMAFDLAMNSNGGIQTLVVCEEAHRYIPADESTGFWPTRQAIARIAKEGRKYGVFLSIITQRPGELDPTILSQCNTIFAMRLGNEKDQEIIRGAVTNGAKSTISFLSSIANRECVAFGEAIHTPMRMTFETMRAEDLPGARIYEQQKRMKEGKEVALSPVLRKMRMEERSSTDNGSSGIEESSLSGAASLSSEDINVTPGDDINSILNAAYAGPGSANTSLAPARAATGNGSLNSLNAASSGQPAASGGEPVERTNVVNNLRASLFKSKK